MFENPIDRYKHMFYTYHQQKHNKDLSSNGVGAPSDRPMYII